MSDSILEAAARARDAGPDVIDATIGILRDDDGNRLVFPSVQAAMRRLDDDDVLSCSRLGMDAYRDAVHRLLGDFDAIASIATAGGEEALSLNLRLFERTHTRPSIVMTVPAWIKHADVCRSAGFDVIEAPYLADGKPSIGGIVQGIRSGAKAALIQAGGHSPTGLDYTPAQKNALAQVMRKHRTAAMIDFAYQGIVDEPEKDAAFIKTLVEHDVPTFVAWSASKNHNIPEDASVPYMRTGLAAAIARSANQRIMFEKMYLSLKNRHIDTSINGQRIVSIVQQELQNEWRQDLQSARMMLNGRRKFAREQLPKSLAASFNGGGLFAQPHLTIQEVMRMRDYKIILPEDGRVNIGGIPLSRMPDIVKAIQSVKENR